MRSEKVIIWMYRLLCSMCLMLCGCSEQTINFVNRAFPPMPVTPSAALYTPYQDPEPEGFKIFNYDVLYYIEKSPNKYNGQLYAFMGDVIQASEADNGIVFQMLTKNTKWMPHNDNIGPSLIVAFSQPNTPIIKNSRVKVLGYLGQPVEGYNAFGASISSLTMNAIAVYDASYEGISYSKKEGKVFYSEKDETLVKQWKSGFLFNTCDRSKPQTP